MSDPEPSDFVRRMEAECEAAKARGRRLIYGLLAQTAPYMGTAFSQYRELPSGFLAAEAADLERGTGVNDPIPAGDEQDLCDYDFEGGEAR